MSTETKTEKAPSKKKALNQAKYAVVAAERAEERVLQRLDKVRDEHTAIHAKRLRAQEALDALLAAA